MHCKPLLRRGRPPCQVEVVDLSTGSSGFSWRISTCHSSFSCCTPRHTECSKPPISAPTYLCCQERPCFSRCWSAHGCHFWALFNPWILQSIFCDLQVPPEWYSTLAPTTSMEAKCSAMRYPVNPICLN